MKEELRRKVNENLVALRSGRIAREVEREKELAAERRLRLKAAEKRVKAISKLSKERDELAEYLDQLLEGEGSELVDECDAALEGVTREIADLTEELKGLLS